MIIWINGYFGSGKTHTAAELHRRIPESYLYDPENFGYFLRKNEPESLHQDNFQDEPLWRKVNRDLLCHIASHYPHPILAPMTLVEPLYYREIIGGLREDGVEVAHFVLYPSAEVVRKRLKKRGDGGDSWAWQQYERCRSAFENEIFENKIPNDSMTIAETAEKIAETLSLSLLPREGAFARMVHWVRTSIGAMR